LLFTRYIHSLYSLAPSLAPSLAQCDDWCDDDWRGPQPEEQDLFDSRTGTFGAHDATRAYCDLLMKLAKEQRNLGTTNKSIKTYRRILELDTADVLSARSGLLSILMDEAAADEARALIDQFPKDNSTQVRHTKKRGFDMSGSIV